MATNPPTPAEIFKFRDDGARRMGTQLKLYKEFTDLYLQQNAIDVMKAQSSRTQVKPVGIGEAGFAVDQRTSVLLGDIYVRYAPLGDAKAEKHVSGKLEPFVNTALTIMDRQVRVRAPSVRQMLLHGIAYNLGPLPAPAFWAGKEMEEAIELGGKEAADEYRSIHFPIVWRHMDTQDVVVLENDRGDPYKVTYTRMMTAGDIVDRWGDGALPDKGYSLGPITVGRKGYSDSEQVKVVDYVDDTWICSLVGEQGHNVYATPPWEHHMGTTPVTAWIGNELPKNKDGLRYAGVLMHPREMMESRDETMTDWRTTIREFATAPPVAYLDTEARSKTDGWPTEVKVEQGETVNMMKGEDVRRYPSPEPTDAVRGYLEKTDQYLGNQLYREALGGVGGAGDSAAFLNTANQAAKAELVTYIDGHRRAYVRAAELILRSVCALNHGKSDPNPVTVRTADPRRNSEAIELVPDDTKAYFDLGSANLKLALPVNENFNLQNYDMAVKSGGMDPWLARQVFLDIQDPAKVDERRAEYDLLQIVVGAAMERAKVMAQQSVGTAGLLPLDKMLANSGDLPSYVPSVLARLGSAPPGQPPPETRGGDQGYDPTNRNIMGTGQPQQNSDLAALATAMNGGGPVV